MDFERALAGKASCSSVSNRCVASKVVSDDPLRLGLLLSEEQIHRSVRKLNIVQLLERVQKLRQSVMLWLQSVEVRVRFLKIDV
jgi:hypothetical protein